MKLTMRKPNGIQKHVPKVGDIILVKETHSPKVLGRIIVERHGDIFAVSLETGKVASLSYNVASDVVEMYKENSSFEFLGFAKEPELYIGEVVQ